MANSQATVKLIACVLVALGIHARQALAQLQVDKPSKPPELQIDGPAKDPRLLGFDPKKIVIPSEGQDDKTKGPAAPKPEAAGWQQLVADDADVRAAFKKRLVAEWTRDIEILGERKQAFSWQQFTSQIMFWVVHAFLLAAVIIAVFEFVAANRKRNEAPTSEEVIALNKERIQTLASMPGATAPDAKSIAAVASLRDEGSPTELKMGMEGIALKTALHGVIILALAMGFYFMYLKFVYPISNV